MREGNMYRVPIIEIIAENKGFPSHLCNYIVRSQMRKINYTCTKNRCVSLQRLPSLSIVRDLVEILRYPNDILVVVLETEKQVVEANER